MENNQNIEQLPKHLRKKLLRQEEQRQRAFKRKLKIGLITIFILGVIGFIGWWGLNLNNKLTAKSAAAKEGGIAPDFSLPSTNGETITLSSFRDKKNVLLYFHEGLTCDPCIQQGPELEKLYPEFEKMNVVLLNISFDPVDKLKAAQARLGSKALILSYNSAKTEVDYDLTRFSMGMGRRAGHTFVLVGPDGVIKWRKDYWPSRGHMVAGGTMFVSADEILGKVKHALGVYD